jgi:hypothetical protein
MPIYAAKYSKLEIFCTFGRRNPFCPGSKMPARDSRKPLYSRVIPLKAAIFIVNKANDLAGRYFARFAWVNISLRSFSPGNFQVLIKPINVLKGRRMRTLPKFLDLASSMKGKNVHASITVDYVGGQGIKKTAHKAFIFLE